MKLRSNATHKGVVTSGPMKRMVVLLLFCRMKTTATRRNTTPTNWRALKGRRDERVPDTTVTGPGAG